MSVTAYTAFLDRKAQGGSRDGFRPSFMPDFLFDFQKSLVEWSVEIGRGAEFADCGLGKTPMQLVWAENVVRHCNKPVLILTPLAVGPQTVREGEKFGIECRRSMDGQIHSGINVTNYERLHYFNANDFAGVVCDESSAIKQFGGERQKAVTDFMRKVRYRLLCTATAAPNDHIEFGTSSEALGYLGRMDMLATFFKSDENTLHPTGFRSKWLFKAHAEEPFWRWLSSWARAVRKPSDLGFDDGPFALPPLHVRESVVENRQATPGRLFAIQAITEEERREERKLTLNERCEKVAELLGHDSAAVAWAHLNDEADLLENLIPDAAQIKGSDPDEKKEETFLAFATGQLKKLVTKPKIGAWGLNWQHCGHMTFFPSHSFEQYYQGVRRCWRFGRTEPVTVDLVASEGEVGVVRNLERKARQADQQFAAMVAHMSRAAGLDRSAVFDTPVEVPIWLL